MTLRSSVRVWDSLVEYPTINIDIGVGKKSKRFHWDEQH